MPRALIALASAVLLLVAATVVAVAPLAAADEAVPGEGKLESAGSAIKSAAANAFGVGSDIGGVPVNPSPGGSSA
uniref:ATP-binding protein n=1 Tax=Oryza punctata TaxID=4537 RepID=A0A0E0M2G1_ORYPU